MSALISQGSNLIGNYVTEVAASFLFGLGYYLFQGKKQNTEEENEAKNKNNKISEKENLKNLKKNLEDNLKKYQSINSIEEFNKVLQNPNENFNAQEILRVITAKGLSANIETFNFLLISSFFNKKFEEAFILKNEILDITGPVIPNSTTLNIIIKGFGLYYKYLKKYEIKIPHDELCLEYDLQIQKVLQNFHERGIKPEIIALNYILEILYEQGRLADMWSFYEKFIEANNYNNNLNNINNDKNVEKENILLFSENEKENNENLSTKKEKFSEVKIGKIPADHYTYILLLKSVKNLFTSDVKLNSKIDNEKETNINKVYSKRILSIAESLMNIKNIKLEESVYNTIIELCIRFDKIEEAQFYFKNLLQEYNFNLREYSFCLMVKAYAKVHQLDKSLEIFNFLKMKKKSTFEENSLNNIKNDLNNLNIKITSENNNSNNNNYFFDDSKSVISNKSNLTSLSDKFNSPYPSTISYCSIMNACIRCNDIKKCEEFAMEMERFNIPKNAFVYSILINGYRKSKQYTKAINLFENLVNFLNTKNFAHQLTMNNKGINKNNEFIRELSTNNVHTTENTLHYNYNNVNNENNIKKKFLSESIITEKEKEETEKVNIVLFNNILDCCIDCEYYEKMEEIFKFLQKYSQNKAENFYNISPDLITYSTLMKGYAKANNVKKVLEIYEFLLKEKKEEFKLDAFLYNIILDSMARNKDYDGMIRIYTDMKNMGIQTSIITYGILIKFYVNVNDVENTIELYEDLINKGLKPSIIIYQLIIKLYAKNNMAYKCIDVFKNMILMGVKPDLILFNTILRVAYDNLYMKEGLEIILKAFNFKIALENEYYEYLLEYLIYKDEIDKEYINNNQFNFDDREPLTEEERVKGVEAIKNGLENLGVNLPKNVVNEINKFLNFQKYKSMPISNYNENGKFNKFDKKNYNDNNNYVNKNNLEETKNYHENRNKNNNYDNNKKYNKFNNKHQNSYVEEDKMSTISQNMIQKNQFKDFNYEFEMDLQNNTESFYPLETTGNVNNKNYSKNNSNNKPKYNYNSSNKNKYDNENYLQNENQSAYKNNYPNNYNNNKKHYNSYNNNVYNNKYNKNNNYKQYDNPNNRSLYDY